MDTNTLTTGKEDIASVPDATQNGSPIFIMGIRPRSGTNFFSDLLCLHPECGSPGPVWEDYLMRHTDPLVQYSNKVFWHWLHAWDKDTRLKNRKLHALLLRHLGIGLSSFLASQTQKKRVVTKTPSVVNLGRLFEIFPNAHLLILVRDGRAVVESGVKSFGWKHGWTYEAAMQGWSQAARTILEFDKSTKPVSWKYLIVRYEDLIDDLEPTLRRLFAFLDLDPEAYDFQAALTSPVRGSSIHRGGGNTPVHWKPIEKSSDFNSIPRWNHWTLSLRERFNRVAGPFMRQLGYDDVQQERPSNFRQRLRHTSLDILWWVNSKVFRELLKALLWWYIGIKGRRFEETNKHLPRL